MDKKKVKRTFILAGRLIDGISDKVEENQAIAIEDGRVSEISRITSALWELEMCIRDRSCRAPCTDPGIFPSASAFLRKRSAPALSETQYCRCGETA